jgi:fructose-specific phosphotransferase system IIC component
MRDEQRRHISARAVAAVLGSLAVMAVYVSVAPFRCRSDGWCHGLVAFDYEPRSAGHWQAVGAAALVGGFVAMLAWVSLPPSGSLKNALRVVVTALLAPLITVSLVSQSIMMVIGPVLGAPILWLMWSSSPPLSRLLR